MRKNFGALLLLLAAGISILYLLDTIKQMDKVLENKLGEYAELKETHEELRNECQKSMVFQNILGAIDRNDYNRETNNCYDHSKALQKKLAAVNIKSSIMVSKDRGHAWVGVWLESTSGKFIPATTSLDVLEMRDEKLDVICD